MAVRLRLRHQDEIREKIRASQLVNFLQEHALTGKPTKNVTTRIRAAAILLDKSLPSLSMIQPDPDAPPSEINLKIDTLVMARQIALTLALGDQRLLGATLREEDHALDRQG